MKSAACLRYGIRSLSAVWNQHEVLYIINPKELHIIFEYIMSQIPTVFNEIAQDAMKSSLRSDEICYADEIKSVLLPTK